MRLGPRHGRARPLRIDLADDVRDLLGRASGELVGPVSGQELIEQQAERVDVGRERDRLAQELLGARILRRHRPGQRRHRRISLVAGIEDLGDAEIEQLWLTVRGHQHVPRLEVAVDDVVIVRVLHGVENAQAQAEPLGRAEAMLVRVAIDRNARDVLHDEVRQALRRGAAVEEARDVWMVQGREDLAFVAKAPDHELGVHAAANHLERDVVLELVVGAAGEIDRAHAAAPEALFD